MAYASIEQCRLYPDDFQEWSRKTRSDKTWGNFKAHFAQSFKETRRSSRTSETKGYAAHVHAAQANAEIFTDMQQDPILGLVNIATVTQADRTSVALLTKNISGLSSQVAHLTEKLSTAQAENAWMKNRYINQPQPVMDIGRPATRPRRIITQAKIEMYTLEADRGSTLTGTAPPKATMWRVITCMRHVASPEMVTTSQLHN